MADDAYVVSTVKYLKRGGPPPVMMIREPREGEERRRFQWDRREVAIHDVRGRESDFTLDSDTVVDGTGAPARVADVAIRDGRIAAIEENRTDSADRVIDAEGKIAGFAIRPKQ